MYNVSNRTLKVGQAVQYNPCVLSLKTAEIYSILHALYQAEHTEGGGGAHVAFLLNLG